MTIKKIPQKDRHLAIASGDVQCAATTVETWVGWNAAGVATTQIFQLDKSYGADGMVVKPGIAKISDLKGKTVAASPPGTSPYFALAWFLKKNGLSIKDVKIVTLEPQPAANAIIAGTEGIDAAMTYEPYLSAVRAKPEAGKIIATTLDYPMVMDTFGCTPKFLAENPKAAKALADGYFDALEMIKSEPKKSFEIMGADVKQTGEAFEKSQAYLRWQDRAANQKFFAGEHAAVHQGSRRPAARGRRDQADAGPEQARRHPVHQVTKAAPAAFVILSEAKDLRPQAVPAPTSISHGPTKPSAPSKAAQRVLDLAPDRVALGLASPAIIWCSAPKDSRSKRTHSAAHGSSHRRRRRARTSMSRKPALASVASSTPSPPSENGPGWPGSGGGRRARSRIILTGSEKNAFRSGVE